MRATTRRSVPFLLLPLFTLLVACGGDDPAGPDGSNGSDGDLTEEEAIEMMEALAAAGAFAPPSPDEGSASSASASGRVPVSYDVETSAACPGGGTVQLTGSASGEVDQDTGAGSFNVSMTQVHDACVADSESGTTFTFDGAPDLDTSMDFTTLADGSFSVDGSHGGGIAWATGDRSGTCSIDLSYDFSGSENSFSGSVTGTVCGISVSESLEFG